MGEVYKARDTRLNRIVAVKVLRRILRNFYVVLLSLVITPG
jgi:hypothetical protein